jgi:hypothetical protein
MPKKFAIPSMQRAYPAAEMVGMLVDTLEFAQETIKQSPKGVENIEETTAVLEAMAKAFRNKAGEIEKNTENVTASELLNKVMSIK